MQDIDSIMFPGNKVLSVVVHVVCDHPDYILSKINNKRDLLRRPIDLTAPVHLNGVILPSFDYGHVICRDLGNTTLTAELEILHNKAAVII